MLAPPVEAAATPTDGAPSWADAPAQAAEHLLSALAAAAGAVTARATRDNAAAVATPVQPIALQPPGSRAEDAAPFAIPEPPVSSSPSPERRRERERPSNEDPATGNAPDPALPADGDSADEDTGDSIRALNEAFRP